MIAAKLRSMGTWIRRLASGLYELVWTGLQQWLPCSEKAHSVSMILGLKLDSLSGRYPEWFSENLLPTSFQGPRGGTDWSLLCIPNCLLVH
jgi:hypothetical protein